MFLSKIKQNKTLWGRWCLPSFNPKCDQFLKGALADIDNNLCNKKPIHKTKINKDNEINPWENPTLMVIYNSFGI